MAGMPGGLSPDAYLERYLRPLDGEHFSGAGFLPYRRKADGQTIEVLLPKEAPWNSMAKTFDPLGFNIFGGKRIPRQERTVEVTATRVFLETLEDMSPSMDASLANGVVGQCSFVMWYPLGKFALLAADVTGKGLDDVPDRFGSRGPPTEEYKVNALGIKRWVKNIQALEWVDGSKLTELNGTSVCDLLNQYLKVNAFREFLRGSFDLSTLPASPPPPNMYSAPSYGSSGWGGKKGGGKGGWDSGKGGKGGWDSGKGGGWKGGPSPWGGPPMMNTWGAPKGQQPMMPVYGGMKGGPMPAKGGPPMYMDYMGFDAGPPPPPPPAPPPMMTGPGGPVMPGAGGGQDPELQRQMYGEQLYMLVQPLAPSPYFAQKITGMLLELPMNELTINLTNQEELRRRVEEAMEVLREDGILQ